MTPPAPFDSTTFVLRRIFSAPCQRVFRSWITPEALEYWFRPGGRSVTVSKLDAYVGGSFCFDIEDGGSIVGTYLHIHPPEKLIFTWAGKITQGRATVVTLDFYDQGPVTEVVLTHERLVTPEMRKSFGAGWQPLFDLLTVMFDSHSGPPDTLDEA